MNAPLSIDDAAPGDRAQACADTALRLMPRFHRWAAARIESNPLDDRLSLRQLATMFALCDGSLSAGALARRMKVTPAVVTGIVDRLERRDYVRRQADPDDRRRQALALTPTGQDAMRRLAAGLAGELARELDTLTPEELTRMDRALADFDRIMARLDRDGRRPAASRRPSPKDDVQETSMTELQQQSTDAEAPAEVGEERFVLELFGQDARATAYDRYAEMRERGPVVPVHLEGIFPAGTEGETDDARREELDRLRAARGFVSDVYMVTTHDEGMAALLDDRFSVDPRSTMTPEERAEYEETPREFRPISRSLLTVDPPDHNRLRALVQPSFTGRRMEALRPRIRTLAEGFLDRAEAAAAERGESAPNRRIELISQFAYPLPVTVISDMLGIPEEDRARAQLWSENLIQSRFRQGDADARQGLLDFIDYLKELFERKRREPGDDMITSLVQAEEAGDKLDEDELLSMVFIVYVAGHVTTVNLIGNGVYALLTHPDQLAKVVADPADVAKGLVEEVLRFHGPAEGVFQRIATEDVELAGTKIARGERLMVSLASADRDPAKFANPDVFDIARPDANRHIGFGKGIHACLGAPLARVEGQVAFQLLFERYPEMRLAVPASEIHWNGGFLRGLESLPILVRGERREAREKPLASRLI